MSETPLRIAIEDLGGLQVHAVRGKEELSAAWRFDVVVSGALEAEMERVALGHRAILTLDLVGKRREMHGVVSEVALQEVESHEDRSEIARRARYRVRVVPRMALLRRTQRTRVFQGSSVPQIAAEVLGKAGISAKLALSRTYPTREYCTQYEETDYAFVRRILAEAGIAFYFFSGAAAPLLVPGESIVLVDDASVYPAVAGDGPSLLAEPSGSARRRHFAVRFVANAGDAVGYDAVSRFEVRNAVRPNSAVFRDFDPDRPLVHLQGVAASTEPFSPSPADVARAAAAVAANAASAVARGTASTASTEAFDALATMHVYEHHSPFLFPKWETAAEEAPLLLRQKRRRASIGSGESGCHDLSPGHAFELYGHLSGALDRGWLVTSVRHHASLADPGREGRSASKEPRLYFNEFECVPSEMHHPPKRPKRRAVQVALTATVVGPEGEDIFTDGQGRIKVQFHWDRQGKLDDRSSCWLRTMQPWAGAGWGHQFIPRVGMEAVVVFEGGDPDRPMVIGTHYNGTHPPSFGLPAAKSRSGIRTRSTPSGDGFNELSFEDRSGREELTPVPRSWTPRASVAWLLLLGCAPGTGTTVPGRVESASASTSRESSAPAPSGTVAPSPPRWSRADPSRPRAPNLFSPDGRYIVLDDNVVDLETKSRVPLDCDLMEVAWYPGPRLACADSAHTAIVVLDVRDGDQTRYPYAHETLRPAFPSDRFAGWVDDKQGITTLLDIEGGATYPVPGTIDGILEDGGRTVVRLAKYPLEPEGIVNQLWDVAAGKAIGAPYRWQRTQSALSPDGRWAFGANLDEGQFIIDQRTGARRSVATAAETIDAFVSRDPFSPDSARIVISLRGAGVRIVDVATGVVSATLTAKGCETAIKARFGASGPSGDLLVVGGDQTNVCAFDLRSGKLRWRADLRETATFKDSVSIDAMSAHVSEVAFTRDGEGILVGGDTDAGRGYRILLRAPTGEVVTSVQGKECRTEDADGDIFLPGVRIDAQLSVVTLSGHGNGVSCDDDDCGPYYRRCVKEPAPGRDQWKEASPIAVDAKGQRVAGIVGDKIRVWNAITGELLYEQ